MKKYILYGIVLLSALSSCRKEIKSEKGGIDIISNVYFNASKGLNEMQTYHISKLNYSNDTIIEIVPDAYMPEVHSDIFLIKDSIYYLIGDRMERLDDLKKVPRDLVQKKTSGAIFSRDAIPNYAHKRPLTDTILFKKNYKRFEVNSPKSFNRFYVFETDTILPYTMYQKEGQDFGGRIERIDSYNKEKDIFVTMQLLPRAKWDKEAEDMFSFLKFINQKNKK